MKYILLSIFTVAWFVRASAWNWTVSGLTFEAPDELELWNSLSDGLSCGGVDETNSNNETEAEFDEQCKFAPDELKDCQPIEYEKYIKYWALNGIIEHDCHNGYRNRSYDIPEEESGVTAEELDVSRKRHFTDECYTAHRALLEKTEKLEKTDKMKNCPARYKKCTENPDSYFKPKMDKVASLLRKYRKKLYDCAAKQIKSSKQN